jgi:hypothetical protein
MNNIEIFKDLMAELGYKEVLPDQKLYPIPEWAVRQVVRESGLVEDVCIHGVGHPNKEWLNINDPDGKKGFGIHCCCGCCKNATEI